MTHSKLCFRCNKEITSKYGKKFCSNKCAAQHTNVFAAAAVRVDKSKICLGCGIIFERKDRRGKFCNHSCAAKYNNRILYPEKEIIIKDKNGNNIVISGNICFFCSTSCGKKEYCNFECKRNYRIKKWLVGEDDCQTVHGCSKIIRDYLIKAYNDKCEECGYYGRRNCGPSILKIHHVDGNWRNNTPKNIQILCPNCHCHTNNYGSKNMGNGRKWKTKYRYTGLIERQNNE